MKQITAAMEKRILRDLYDSTAKHSYRRFVRYAYPGSLAADFFRSKKGGYYVGIVDAKGQIYVYRHQHLFELLDDAWHEVTEHWLFHYLDTDLYSSSTKVM